MKTRGCDWCCEAITLSPGRSYWFVEQDWDLDEEHQHWTFVRYYHNKCWKDYLNQCTNNLQSLSH